MAHVKARGNEPVEVLLRRFNRIVQKAGIIAELKKREFYEKPSVIKKREKSSQRKRKIARHKKLRKRY